MVHNGKTVVQIPQYGVCSASLFVKIVPRNRWPLRAKTVPTIMVPPEVFGQEVCTFAKSLGSELGLTGLGISMP